MGNKRKQPEFRTQGCGHECDEEDTYAYECLTCCPVTVSDNAIKVLAMDDDEMTSTEVELLALSKALAKEVQRAHEDANRTERYNSCLE